MKISLHHCSGRNDASVPIRSALPSVIVGQRALVLRQSQERSSQPSCRMYRSSSARPDTRAAAVHTIYEIRHYQQPADAGSSDRAHPSHRNASTSPPPEFLEKPFAPCVSATVPRCFARYRRLRPAQEPSGSNCATGIRAELNVQSLETMAPPVRGTTDVSGVVRDVPSLRPGPQKTIPVKPRVRARSKSCRYP